MFKTTSYENGDVMIKVYRATYENIHTRTVLTKEIVVSDKCNMLDAKKLFFNYTQASKKVPNELGFIQTDIKLVDEKTHIVINDGYG